MILNTSPDLPLTADGARLAALFSETKALVMDGKLKRLLCYRENSRFPDDPNLPSIADHLHVLDPRTKKKVLRYMRKGCMILAFMGDTEDPYFKGKWVEHAIYSDGTFIWDGVVLNWIREYDVRVPKVFLDHIDSFDGDLTKFFDIEKKVLAELRKHNELIFVE